MSTRHERKDAMENRQLILQTANQLFDLHGVQSVSMHQIAKTAGIGQATLYRKYAHKGDLCFDMLEHYAKQFIDQSVQFLDDNHSDKPLHRLSGLLELWIDAIEEKAELLIEMAASMNMHCNDPRGNFFLSPMYSFIRNKLSDLILEVIGTPQEQDPEPDLAAHTLICSIAPHGYFHIKQEKGFTKEDMKEHYRRLCFLLFKNHQHQ
ncbi:TetR/AcrR family transcriptional regulator [Paenibacillus roseipurpureus]|uniref:TetR/AcrR family transcriptional regulator n=1 Tax=Paenibacillus roseopurpureus TaxID=2918901 RepID=A0AA96LMC2_9BACL|nr:TetR/AcrR family transcriptional regulator [Paenibacillus sp. MBLB1832]WNR44400.1 TetR/AcrR family transcriptional regulator [Paenibacillus sp. MBLB1832]